MNIEGAGETESRQLVVALTDLRLLFPLLANRSSATQRGPSCGQPVPFDDPSNAPCPGFGQLPTPSPSFLVLFLSSSATRESLVGRMFPRVVHVHEPDMIPSSRLQHLKIQSIKPSTSISRRLAILQGAQAINLTDRPSFDGTLSHVVSHRPAWMCKTRAKKNALGPFRVRWRRPACD